MSGNWLGAMIFFQEGSDDKEAISGKCLFPVGCISFLAFVSVYVSTHTSVGAARGVCTYKQCKELEPENKSINTKRL